ncbi:mucin-binding protein [Secundilactobacillus yichangensis]|uniref:mucin-binding protein n=1 Tax=Secundilactobacillus yichangensis TaxID=2799580 RepID=UPI001940AA83|nr:KxYKxGKxW signal peptide domain-containing protein [Secundilactobacillus yichangensis]
MLGKNNKIRDFKTNTVIHYKSYKAGKRWVFAGLAALSMGAGIFFGGLNAQASTDVTDNNQAPETNQVDTAATAKTSTKNTTVPLSSSSSTTNAEKANPVKAAQPDQSKPAATASSAASTQVANKPTTNNVTTNSNQAATTNNQITNKSNQETTDVTNLKTANSSQIEAAKAAAEAVYEATGKAQKITASLDNVAPSVQLGSTTLSSTHVNNLALGNRTTSQGPTVVVTGNAKSGDTVKIDLPPIFQIKNYDTNLTAKANSDNSVTYSFDQDTAYTLHIYTVAAPNGSFTMDTDGTTPMNLTVTKDSTPTVYPLKVTTSPSLSPIVYVDHNYNGQGQTLNLANAVNGVIPDVTLAIRSAFNSSFYIPKITQGSYSFDVPKGFVANQLDAPSGVTMSQSGGAGAPVTLIFSNYTTTNYDMSLNGSIKITDQTTGTENFAKNNVNGTLQIGAHSILPISVRYLPLTYVDDVAKAEPVNYVTGYAGMNTWPKFDNDQSHDIGLYSVVTGGAYDIATPNQVTFNVPDGVMATKITTPAYAANITVTLKSGKQVQYNDIVNSVITGTANDPIVSVTSKSIAKQNFFIDTKASEDDYSDWTANELNHSLPMRFFVSGYLPNAKVGDSYVVKASNDDAAMSQTDQQTFTVADYGTIQYNGYDQLLDDDFNPIRTPVSTDDNGIRYAAGNPISDTYTFTNSQNHSLVGPEKATYYVVVPSNAILTSLDNIKVVTKGSQSAVKEVLPQTLNGQEIIKINVNNPQRINLPDITLDYQVSPAAKLGQTVTLNEDAAGSGRFIMAGDFQPNTIFTPTTPAIAAPVAQTTTLKNFAALVDDKNSNMYVEIQPASYAVTSAVAFTVDDPAKTDKDADYPEDLAKVSDPENPVPDSPTFMQKYNETGTLRVNVSNTTNNDVKNVSALVMLPTKAAGNDFSVQVDGSKIDKMTVPAGATVLYSPQKVTDSKTVNTTAQGFVPATGVSDWSTIQSVLVQSPELKTLKQITVYVPIKVADYTAGKTSKADTITMEGSGTDVTDNKHMDVQSKSNVNLSVPKTTINVHYLNPNHETIAAPNTGQEVAGGTYDWTNPTIIGYYAPSDAPISYTVKPTDGEIVNIDVIYVPNKEQLTVKYINQRGYVMATGQETGTFGSTVNIDQKSFSGYTAQAGNPTQYTFVTDGPGNFVNLYYTSQSEKAAVRYVDDDAGGVLLHQDNLTGLTDEINNYTNVKNAITSGFTAQGYLVVGDDLPAKNLIVFGNQPTVTPSYTVHLKHQTETFTPNNPADPNTPIFPKDPNSPTWPAGADKDNLVKNITETVHYVYANSGSTAKPDVKDLVTYTRSAIVDLVTRMVIHTNWVAKGGRTSFSSKQSPLITGYLADIAKTKEYDFINPTSPNVELTVKYSPVGEYTTNMKKVPPIPYPNDPNNPSTINITTIVIPYEPGYQPYGPDGNPLKPVNPNNVTKGFLPPVPTNPLTDTPITYKPGQPGGLIGQGNGMPPADHTTVTPPENNTAVPTPPDNNQTVPNQPENDTSTPEPPVTPSPAERTTVPEPNGKTNAPVEPVAADKGQAVNTQPTTERGTAANEPNEVTSLSSHGTGNSASAAQKLPQTNEQSANWLSLLGLSLLGFLGFGKARRQKKD